MRKAADLTGLKFGRLKVIGKAGKTKNGTNLWRCLCDCEKEHFATTSNLTSGSTISCGCYRKEYRAQMNYVHGKSNTRLNSIWRGMKQRCCNSNSSKFNDYGKRGIKVCDQWKASFKSFYDWAMKNGYDDTKSIDRIDVNGNYCPENCRWVDMEVQANNKRNNHFITAHGETHTLSEWARITGIDRKTISDRIVKFGWSAEKALTEKVRITYDHRRNKAECITTRSS